MCIIIYICVVDYFKPQDKSMVIKTDIAEYKFIMISPIVNRSSILYLYSFT